MLSPQWRKRVWWRLLAGGLGDFEWGVRVLRDGAEAIEVLRRVDHLHVAEVAEHRSDRVRVADRDDHGMPLPDVLARGLHHERRRHVRELFAERVGVVVREAEHA